MSALLEAEVWRPIKRHRTEYNGDRNCFVLIDLLNTNSTIVFVLVSMQNRFSGTYAATVVVVFARTGNSRNRSVAHKTVGQNG